MMKPAAKKIGPPSEDHLSNKVPAAIIFLLVANELIGTGEAQSAFLAGV
jgi:hypothetical protein